MPRVIIDGRFLDKIDCIYNRYHIGKFDRNIYMTEKITLLNHLHLNSEKSINKKQIKGL